MNGKKTTIWSDDRDEKEVRGYAPLPNGIKDGKCPKCHKSKLVGALITETADEADPNILCTDCGYWWV